MARFYQELYKGMLTVTENKYEYALMSAFTENPDSRTAGTPTEYINDEVEQPGTETRGTCTWTYQVDTAGPEHIATQASYKGETEDVWDYISEVAKVVHTNSSGNGLHIDADGNGTLSDGSFGTDSNPSLPWRLRRKVVATISGKKHAWNLIRIKPPTGNAKASTTATFHYVGELDSTGRVVPKTDYSGLALGSSGSPETTYEIQENGTEVRYQMRVDQTGGRTVANTGITTGTVIAQRTADPVEKVIFKV